MPGPKPEVDPQPTQPTQPPVIREQKKDGEDAHQLLEEHEETGMSWLFSKGWN